MPTSTKPSLTLKRRLKAPRARVWEAWTTGQALKRWFGPNDSTTIDVADVDLRPGGRYRIVMRESNGEKHEIGGIYREIQPQARLVFTWAWITTPERESLVTILLEDAGGETELTLTHEHFFDEAVRDRHQHGWNGSLDRLGRHLS